MNDLQTFALLRRKIIAELEVIAIRARLLQIDADQAALNFLAELSSEPPTNIIEAWFDQHAPTLRAG